MITIKNTSSLDDETSIKMAMDYIREIGRDRFFRVKFKQGDSRYQIKYLSHCKLLTIENYNGSSVYPSELRGLVEER